MAYGPDIKEKQVIPEVENIELYNFISGMLHWISLFIVSKLFASNELESAENCLFYVT